MLRLTERNTLTAQEFFEPVQQPAQKAQLRSSGFEYLSSC